MVLLRWLLEPRLHDFTPNRCERHELPNDILAKREKLFQVNYTQTRAEYPANTVTANIPLRLIRPLVVCALVAGGAMVTACSTCSAFLIGEMENLL